MYLGHHETAVRSGARLVHCCGFDSIPHDLGALYTVKQLPSDGPISVRGVVRAEGMASGGTFHSALAQFSRGRQMGQAAKARRSIEPRPEGRRVRSGDTKPTRDSDARLLAAAAADHRPGRGQALGRGARRVRPGVLLRPLRRRQDAAVRRRRVARSRGPGRRRAGAAGAQAAAQAAAAGPGPLGVQAREVVVHRRLRRRGRRPHRPHPGQRRRPRLRGDREDAGRVGAEPGLRRQPDAPAVRSRRPPRWATTSSTGCRRPGSPSPRSRPRPSIEGRPRRGRARRRSTTSHGSRGEARMVTTTSRRPRRARAAAAVAAAALASGAPRPRSRRRAIPGTARRPGPTRRRNPSASSGRSRCTR